MGQEDKIIHTFWLIIWFSIAFGVVVATVLPLIRSKEWWIRWLDFPRLQIFIVGVVVLGLGVQLLWELQNNLAWMVLISALLLSIAYQAYRIFPYTRLAKLQVTNASEESSGIIVKLVTANVLMKNREVDKYLKVLREADPDIILTTEADHWWTDHLQSLDSFYPYFVKYPLENTYGMLLHSRFPLVEPSVRFLMQPDVPSIHSGILLPGGQIIHLVGLHPEPPGPMESEDTAQRDAELILTGKIMERSNIPVMVLGDLNDVAWSRTTSLFQKVSGLLDPRIGRGMFNTFHADYFFIRFPLDHCFHSSHFKLLEMRRLPHIGSDHFPFYAALMFTAEEEDATREPPLPKPEEREEARETIDEGLES